MRLAAWLAVVLVLSKSLSLNRTHEYWWLIDLPMASFGDVLFALGVGIAGNFALRAAASRSAIQAGLRHAFVALCVICAFYAVIAAGVFSYFGRPLTYDLLKLVRGAAAVQSSIFGRLTFPVGIALVGVPSGYYAIGRRLARQRKTSWVLTALLLGWTALGWWQFRAHPDDWFMRHLSVNPHMELVRSTWAGMTGFGKPSLPRNYPREFRDEFKAVGLRPQSPEREYTQLVPPGTKPKNVIVIVLESVGTKYLSLYKSQYDTTPSLIQESANALVFDNFYAHVPYTFCSFMALNFSMYPGMPWCYAPANTFGSFEGQRPLPTTLAALMKKRGARTAYLHNGDLEWGGMDFVLEGQGYDSVEDYRALGCDTLSSWGADDRFLFDRLIRFIDEKPGQPFYAFCWTDQTHDPYELGPGTAKVDFFGDHPPANNAEDLSRYLNVLHLVDQHLADLFRALRERGLADDTLVVITGDHGEAFRDPHDQRGHGYTAYQEDVNVPLILWNPRLFPSGRRIDTIGAHVDLNSTITDLLGIDRPSEWQGHSLFDPARPQRAFFLASIGEYVFGVRDGKWKYSFEATSGRESLTDLTLDPQELKNLAGSEPDICKELRNRVAAWVDFEDEFMRPSHD